MEELNIKEMIKNYRYYDDKSINVLLHTEVNGNFILKERKHFINERHFFICYVYDRLEEEFEILSFDKESKVLILYKNVNKNDIIIRCSW